MGNIGMGNWADEIPHTNLTEDDILSSPICSVCHDDFHVGQRVRRLDCSHLFHDGCLFSWLDRSPTCPLCRSNLMEDEDVPGYDDDYFEEADDVGADPDYDPEEDLNEEVDDLANDVLGEDDIDEDDFAVDVDVDEVAHEDNEPTLQNHSSSWSCEFNYPGPGLSSYPSLEFYSTSPSTHIPWFLPNIIYNSAGLMAPILWPRGPSDVFQLPAQAVSATNTAPTLLENYSTSSTRDGEHDQDEMDCDNNQDWVDDVNDEENFEPEDEDDLLSTPSISSIPSMSSIESDVDLEMAAVDTDDSEECDE